LGKEETVSTIQVGPAPSGTIPTGICRGRWETPSAVMIHRGVISTMERMTAFLIEYYAGAFPVWLSPIQAIILPN
jgi:threonyl-tRNA synthetase